MDFARAIWWRRPLFALAPPSLRNNPAALPLWILIDHDEHQ
jgi:hypothetical protein